MTAKGPKSSKESAEALLLSKIQLALLERLHAELIGNAPIEASLLNVVRQTLKDNNIVVSHSGEDRKVIEKLGTLVPFPRAADAS